MTARQILARQILWRKMNPDKEPSYFYTDLSAYGVSYFQAIRTMIRSLHMASSPDMEHVIYGNPDYGDLPAFANFRRTGGPNP